MMNRTATIPFIWERDESSLNENAVRIFRNEDVKIEYCYIMQKLNTKSCGKWFPVEFNNTGEHVEGCPVWTVTYRF